MLWKYLKVTAEEMKGLADAALLAALAMGSVLGASALAQATWPRRSPAAAILLWQALGLAGGLAAVGTLVSLGLPGDHLGVAHSLLHLRTVFPVASGMVSALSAVFRMTCLAAGLALLASLCWVLIAASAAALQARRRQRALLALLAHGDPKVPGALVVDYPTAAAYCLPGLRSRIVVLSVGTLELLGRAELAAVLAHERAHLRERHDLVLLPFTALRRAFPRSVTCLAAHRAVALLVEMLADDRALRGRPARELVSALVRFGTAGTCPAPAGALAASEGDMAARVARLLQPVRPLPAAASAAVCLTAGLLVAVTVALLIV